MNGSSYNFRILYNLLGNKFIGDDVKQKLRVAARQSQTGGSKWCSIYKCPLIDLPTLSSFDGGHSNNHFYYHQKATASLMSR